MQSLGAGPSKKRAVFMAPTLLRLSRQSRVGCIVEFRQRLRIDDSQSYEPGAVEQPENSVYLGGGYSTRVRYGGQGLILIILIEG
jgi:hypothetical protein